MKKVPKAQAPILDWENNSQATNFHLEKNIANSENLSKEKFLSCFNFTNSLSVLTTYWPISASCAHFFWKFLENNVYPNLCWKSNRTLEM